MLFESGSVIFEAVVNQHRNALLRIMFASRGNVNDKHHLPRFKVVKTLTADYVCFKDVRLEGNGGISI